MPTFTAIVPNYNDSATLPQALDSLLAQTVPFDEIIVIDDGSTDHSRDIIAAYAAKHPMIRPMPNEKNQGIIATLNRGVELASSDFIISCSSNDIYSPREVEYCRDALRDFPDAMMVCGNSATLSAATGQPGAVLAINLPQERRRYTPAEYVALNKTTNIYFNGGAIAMNRAQIIVFGHQRPELKWHADLILYLQFAFAHPFVYVPEIFTTMRVEETGNYSSGRFDWEQQQHVTEGTLRLFKTSPQAAMIRESAILPKYDFRTLLLLLKPEHRWYITPLVIWRCLMHTGFYWLRGRLPRGFLMHARKYFKV